LYYQWWFLILSQPAGFALSLAHLRGSQGQSGQTVLEGPIISTTVQAELPITRDFLASLNVAGLPRLHLRALYQGWIERFEAYSAARLTGRFVTASDVSIAERRRAALSDYERLTREISTIRSRAAKETQMSHRVEFNLQLKQLESSLVQIANDL